MKNVFPVTILLFFALLFSCKKKSDPLDLPSVQPNNRLDTLVAMKCLVNGAAWQTDSVIAYKTTFVLDSSKSNLIVNATRKVNDTTTTISFYITNFTGVNTYTIDPAAISATYYIGTQRHYATSGQIVVTTYANYAIIGTFNFVADSMNITQGVFNVEQP